MRAKTVIPVLALCVGAPAACADLFQSYIWRYWQNSGGFEIQDERSTVYANSGTQLGWSNTVHGSPAQYTDGSTWSRARPKSVSAQAHARAISTGNGYAFMNTRSTAEAISSISYFSPEVAIGEDLIVVGTVRFHGELSCEVHGSGLRGWSSSGSFYTSVNGGIVLSQEARISSFQGDSGHLASGLYSYSFRVPNGSSVLLGFTVRVEAQAQARYDANIESIADLGNTLDWWGVASVTDLAGNAITNYSFTDEFGNDWRTAVPAPGTFALAVAGALTLGRRRR